MADTDPPTHFLHTFTPPAETLVVVENDVTNNDRRGGTVTRTRSVPWPRA